MIDSIPDLLEYLQLESLKYNFKNLFEYKIRRCSVEIVSRLYLLFSSFFKYAHHSLQIATFEMKTNGYK